MINNIKQNPKIMLIDDNPGEVIILRAALDRMNQENIDIEAYQNPLEALEKINTLLQTDEGKLELPNLIFLDINMPEMSGIKLLEILKKIEAISMIPIIILTTSEVDSEFRECYRLHANSVILKPMDFDDYIDLMEISSNYWLNSVYAPSIT